MPREGPVKIRFKKGLELVKEENRIVATLDGLTVWARNELQEKILQQVNKKARMAKTYADELAYGGKDEEKNIKYDIVHMHDCNAYAWDGICSRL